MYTTLISTDDLARHYQDGNWVLVDCRFSLADAEAGRRAYRQEHLPGARYAHLDEDLSGLVIPGTTGRHPLPDINDLTATFSNWGVADGVQVVAYDDTAGAYAARLWWLLRWLGHDAVAVLDGGLPVWKAEGRPLTAEVPLATFRRFDPRPRPDLLVDAGFVDYARRDPACVVIDARAPERYRGEVEPIDPVAGHIPGAVNAPHAGNVGPDQKLISQHDLRHRYGALLRGKPAGQAVCYCGSGVTACHDILAMQHAGLGEAKLYPGSWSEWITGPEREIGKG